MNTALRSFAIKIFNRVPKRLSHAPIYFRAKKLLEMTRQYPDAETTKYAIASQLSTLLQGALKDVPFYQQLKIDPRAINSQNAFEALKQFPFLTKEEIMEDPRRLVSRRYNIDRLRIVTSGGSTGKGIKIYKNYSQMCSEWAFIDYEWQHEINWQRYKKAVRIGSDSIRRDDQLPYFFEADRLMISPYHTTEKFMPEIIHQIEKFHPQYFHVFASCIMPIVNELKKMHKTLPYVKGVMLASERVSIEMLNSIPEVFPNAKTVVLYGLTERTNLAWGKLENGEISYKFDSAYSFSENYLHEDGRYEIVGTNYWNDVMPLIRYRTNDFGQINSRGWMSQLDGRGQEFLIGKNGCKFQGFAIYIDEATWDYVKQFQIVQREIGKIEFHVVPRATKLPPEVCDFILNDQKKKWGNIFDMSVVEEKSIPRTKSGKTRLVVSLIS